MASQTATFKKRSCVTGNWVRVWSVPKRIDCPNVKKVQNVILHLDQNKNPYRAGMKQLGISLRYQIQCPKSVSTCFSKNAVCDPSGIVISPKNCSKLQKLKAVSHSKITYSGRVHTHVRYVTENADIMVETIKQLNVGIHFLECQIPNLFTTLYSILGRQFPGQVLSFLLYCRTAGVTIGDVTTERAWEPTNTTILLSLNHGKYFSSRPLVEFLDSSGKPIIEKIYRDGNVYPEVKFLKKFIPGGTLTFNINNTYYTFQNYTLTHANSEGNTLSPTIAPITAHFGAINFQALTHFFPATDMGFEDLISLLGIISKSNIIRNQL